MISAIYKNNKQTKKIKSRLVMCMYLYKSSKEEQREPVVVLCYRATFSCSVLDTTKPEAKMKTDTVQHPPARAGKACAESSLLSPSEELWLQPKRSRLSKSPARATSSAPGRQRLCQVSVSVPVMGSAFSQASPKHLHNLKKKKTNLPQKSSFRGTRKPTVTGEADS